MRRPVPDNLQGPVQNEIARPIVQKAERKITVISTKV